MLIKHMANIMSCLFLVGYNTYGQNQTDTIVDRDGNRYIIRKMPDNNVWMMDNLRLTIAGSYCYANEQLKCDQYGRLYTWKSAVEGCKILGDGWHLPSHEEWELMAEGYGGFYGDSKDSGRTAYKALLYGGKAKFNALLGGGREIDSDSYTRIDRHGFYWTSSDNQNGTAWFSNFGKGSQKLFMQNDGEQSRAFSVRCLLDGNSK